MRILVINDAAGPHIGGMNRMVCETCDWLARAGHEVALAYHDGHAVEVACPVFHVSEELPVEQRCAALRQAAARYRPELIFNHSTKVNQALPQLSEEFPLVTFVHDQSLFCSGGDRMSRSHVPCHRAHGLGCLPLHYLTGCGGKHPLNNWSFWRAVPDRMTALRLPRARIQVASRFMLRGLLENGVPEERVDIVPLFAEPPPAEAPTDPGLLLLPARLVRGKGVQMAIRATALLPDLRWQLVIAGTGPYRGVLESLAARSGVADRVRFLGEISPMELAPWYSRAQLVLFPVLRPEPFGLIGVEALAYGKPIVALAGGAVDEWLWPGETGLRVDERSPAAFAAAIRELLGDPARCAAMGEAAKRRYPQFHPTAYIERLVASFERTRSWAAK